MVASASEPYDVVKDDLARAIRTERSDCVPGELARQLVAFDRPEHLSLVGINRACNKVVYYHEAERYAIAANFGPDGVGERGVRIGSFDVGPGLECWIEKTHYFWSWLHPRYR